MGQSSNLIHHTGMGQPPGACASLSLNKLVQEIGKGQKIGLHPVKRRA
jgi:hypothetical protein